MKSLVKICTLSLFAALLPITAWAQQQSDDDPFRRDPIFSKSIEDLLGIKEEDEDHEEFETDRDTRRRIRHLNTTGIDLGGSLEAGPYYSNPLYSQYPNLPMIHYNRVNGLFLGIRKERMQWHRYDTFLSIPQIQPHGFIGYGTASKQWEYALGVEKLFGFDKRFMIGGEIHNATATEDYHRVGLVESSLTSFFSAYDFLDYYKMEGFGFYGVYRTQRWIEAAVSYNRDTFSSVENNTSYSLFGRTNTIRTNPPVDGNTDEIDIGRIGLAFSFNPKHVLLTDRFTFSSTLMAELAGDDFSDEAYKYDKYQGNLKLFYNFEPGSVLRWRISAGGITGNAPDFKQFYLGGIGTLRGSPYKFFQGNQMLLSNLEIQFGRPSGYPGEWFRHYNMHVLLFIDSGWARNIPELLNTGNPFAGFKEFSFADFQHDAGFGIGTGAFRFEVAWPLKQFDKTAAFWLRFNPTF